MEDPAGTDVLRDAIRHLHGAESRWLESVPVREEFRGEVVWDGVVQVFELVGHPTARRCYAWSHVVEGTTRRRFVAVLHEKTCNSPEMAVKAAIIQEGREKLGRKGN